MDINKKVMKKMDGSFISAMERYVFGTVRLREEIQQYKQEDTERWNLLKKVGIRAVYGYSLVVTVILVGIGVMWQEVEHRRIRKVISQKKITCLTFKIYAQKVQLKMWNNTVICIRKD